MVAASVPATGHRSGSTASSPSSKTRCSKSTWTGASSAAGSRLAATAEAVRAVPLERPAISYPRFERPVIRLPVGKRVAIVAVAAAAALGAFVGSSLQKPASTPAPGGGPQLSFRTDQNLLRQLPHQPKQPASPEPTHVPGQPPEGFV
jgi:hypothetical protein